MATRLNTADISALSDLGLSNAEIRIYLSLLELGLVKAGQVIQRTGLQNSVVHLTLAKLVDKGLVSFIRRGKVRHYKAADPQNILRTLDEKRKNLERLLPSLIARQKRQEKQEVEVFEGFGGLKSMLYQAIEDCKPGDEYLFFSFNTSEPEDYEEVFRFYEEFEQDRSSRGLVVKGIVPASLRNRFSRRQTANIVFVKFPTIQNLSICGNKVIMTPWDDRQVSFLITSRQLADNFRQHFYTIWDAYKAGSTKR